MLTEKKKPSGGSLFDFGSRKNQPDLGIFGDRYTVDKKLDKRLYEGMGDAQNPFQAIIQGLAFENPRMKGFGDSKKSVLPFGLGDLERTELFGDESNSLRAFIYELMNNSRKV